MPRALPPSASPLALGDIVLSVAESFSGDRALEGFKQDIKQRFKVRFCHLASSGRAALSLAFLALHRLAPHKDVVALPAFTSYSVAAAAVRAGMRVRLYDLDPQTLGPDPDSFAAALSPGVLAAVVCHLFGYPCAMESLGRIARAHDAPLIDDAAQAMGAQVDGRAAGTHGLAGVFSLSRGKNITAVDGGILVTDDPDLDAALLGIPLERPRLRQRLLAPAKALALSLLLRPGLYWLPRSIPGLGIGRSVFEPDFDLELPTPFQAALGRRMLKKLPDITAGRRKTARDIQQAAAARGDAFPARLPDADPVYLRLPCLSRDGREDPELGVVGAYPKALCDLPGLAPYLTNPHQDFPVARRLARELVTAPTHCFVSPADISRIARGIA